MTSRTGSDATAAAMRGRIFSFRVREKSRTVVSFLNAISRMPSNLRSNVQSAPTNRSWVSVAAIGSIQSGNSEGELWFGIRNGGLCLARSAVRAKFFNVAERLPDGTNDAANGNQWPLRAPFDRSPSGIDRGPRVAARPDRDARRVDAGVYQAVLRRVGLTDAAVHHRRGESRGVGRPHLLYTYRR